MAEGKEKKPEYRDPVDAPSGPVHPRAEVARQCLADGAPAPQHRAQPRGRDGAGNQGGQAGHDEGHVGYQHDVEGRAVGLLVHADIFTVRAASVSAR